MSTIEVQNVGAVRKISIPVPEGGGVVVMRGRNGSGKSTALNAAAALLAGDGKLAKRDGADRGQVEGFGAVIRVAGQTRRSGELEVTSLEGRLSLADLVDPGIDNPTLADKRRINAICSLGVAPIEPEMFHELVGGAAEFEELGLADLWNWNDKVDSAARMRRRLHELAREAEAEQAQQEGAAKAAQAAADAAPAGETDGAKLQAALEAALREQATIEAFAKSTEAEIAAAAEAKRRWNEIAEAESGEPPYDAAAADRQCHELADLLDSDAKRVKAAKEAVEKAERELVDAITIENARRKTLGDAQALHRELVALELAIGKATAPVSPADLQKAAQAVQDARVAVERGAVARAAAQHREAAQRAAKAAQEVKEAAAGFREAAAGIDGVLSEAVGKLAGPLRVEDGRLVCDTDRCKGEHYSDLSDGERWKVAIDVAANASPRGSIFTISQNAYEGLDPRNRQLIANHARERGIVILTAEATDGELRAEVDA